MSTQRRNYDDGFNRAAIRLGTVNGHSLSETARNLGINAKMLGRWKREEEAKQNSTSATSGVTSEVETELRQLRNEVKRLRMEREILKKALGYFANESN